MKEELSNLDPLPITTQIREDVFKIAEDMDVDRMLTEIVTFIRQMGLELSAKMRLHGAGKDYFASAHITSKEEQRMIVAERNHGEISPDTVRKHFLSFIVPNMIENTLLPFYEPGAETERHAVLPYISGLYDSAWAALATIEDPDLALEATQELGKIREKIGADIRSSGSTIN